MADIIRLRGDLHRQTQGLLPWYANGTLDADEAAAVAAHLADCAECRAELEAERALGEQIASLPDRGWASLRSRLEGRSARRGRWPAALLRHRVPIGWAVAAQAACLALIVGVGWIPSQQSQRPVYRALGAPAAAAPGNVVVIFRPTTSEAELRDTLRQSGARLVGGPTASDAYVLHVAAAQRSAALARLRSDRHVVLAEPIDGDSQP